MATTRHVPYHVCGAQQDSTTACLPSDAGSGGRGGGRGDPPRPTMPVAASQATSRRIRKTLTSFLRVGNNGTFMTRLNRRTGELREVNPYPRMFSGEPASALK